MARVSPDDVSALRVHKQSGQAIVTLSARDYSLGQFDSPESRVKYQNVVAEWLANNRSP